MVLYQIRNTKNNKRYIGQTIQLPNNRWVYHRKRLNNGTHTNPHLLRAWRKYGESAFEFTVLKSFDSLKALNEAELKYIQRNTNGYNLRAGGDNGGAHAEETKKKISKALKGKVSPMKGKKSPKTKQWMQNIIKARIPNGYPDLVNPDGVVTSIVNVKKFCRENQLQQACIRNVISGYRTHHKGWRLATKKTIGTPFKFFQVSLKSPNGTIYNVENLNQFCKNHQLSAGNVSEMIRGNRKQCKGWTMTSSHLES